ncbi:MAG TPA: TetR/AcrR family transcriptional regulator [Acidimicrobiia bacterium]|nr:TetR/AcrR family transcriptional regulator [Acidimicrobiia bacterium]
MPVRSNATKDRILAAAAQLFAEKGYHGTGMGDLEQAVNLRRGALYYHIGNKESLLYEISLSLVAEMQRLADEVEAADITADEKLRLLARGLMRMIGERQAEITVFYREWSWLTGERREQVLAARDHFEGVWRKLLVEGAAEGTFVDKPPVLVKGILGVVNYSYLWFRSSGSMTADAVADEFVDMILYGIAASPPKRNGRRRS